MSQIFSETRSKIHAVSEDKTKVYTFDVPSSTSLGEAYDMLTKIRAKIWEKLEEEKKSEENCEKDCKKNECKADLQSKTNSKKEAK